MSTPANNIPLQNLDELDRQLKQAEMIRQYLQVTNVDRNTALNSNVQTGNVQPIETESNNTNGLTLSSFNFDHFRHDLKMAEERVERLRHEIKDLQRKRDEPLVKVIPPPPPSYTSTNVNLDYLNSNLSIGNNRNTLEMSPVPFVQELLSTQNQRQIMNNGLSSSILIPNYNSINHLTSSPNDVSIDHRHRKLYLTLCQHREQLNIYLDSLKQALNSLDRVASLEPTNNEIQQTNIKLDTIQQKTRQLHALKSNRSSQQSPFIECRIRQLEHELVQMLSEHQRDVQAKLELNEQRSVMLLKIMQITDELNIIDQQIQQTLPNTTTTTATAVNDLHRRNSSPLLNEINQQSTTSFRILHSPNNFDGRRISFRDTTIDNNPLTKLPPVYYHHY